ncbi:adenylyltransferase and sulfurtransferase [Brevibacterium siliguriense]|uniref:Adenylyltransferase and sulfurtransferase n=1 Tax=Brevibacterium siliguriense TaxID=1136497 RepID=A0A1H1UP41_9MICO|nr:ThiF family adenylyltransferase [Brevibacterium siliguriense]SDS74071.1 adenylyltransferase and sulfurtransferase [Brevibacterium siliguriense]
MSTSRLDPADRARYARQIRLSGFGESAQAALLDSHVLVIGAGGLGAPILSYLAAVGIGTITVVDPDIVELSNLHRQVIHSEAAIGTRKIDSAQERMNGINSSVQIRTIPQLLTPDNALGLFDGVDIVIDGSDNFATRYLANDACEILGLPLVWGTILGFDGQVAVFDAKHGATLRDLYPEVPAPGSVPDCSVAGVLGPLCGSIGSAMAMEAIKVLTGIGTPLYNSVAIHSSLDAGWETVPVQPIPGRPSVTDLEQHFADYTQHAFDSDVADGDSAERAGDANAGENALGPATLTWADIESNSVLVDIRDDDEVAAGMVPGAIHIPMDELLADPGRLPLTTTTDTTDQIDSPIRPDASRSPGIALYCRSGVRSARAAAQLRSHDIAVSSVNGGYLAFLSQPAPQRS